MAAAVGPGGAEMGQRSARVAGTAAAGPGTTSKTLTTEALATEGTWRPTFGIQGLDVSGHQASVNWQQQWNLGARFAYVKATEGNYYASETFASQYQGSRSVGMVRGAYHFAIPNWSSGADQARYFVKNGGGWSADGYTLPPVLDIEFNPYAGRTINGFNFGNSCYDMTPAQLTSWVRDFGNTMLSLTGRLPVIYTNTSWWKQCTADAPGLFGDYPLWVAAYPSAPSDYAGLLPSSWSNYSIWQYSSTGPFTGDSNVWNGDYAGLRLFASGYGVKGGIASAWAAVGGGDGKLGYPTSNEICGLVNGGCYQRFQGG
ncbi:Lyzozyme M1 (1,4-beta-N-acetylmuramidase), GH25 family, partial [Arthrobacter sp. ok362]